MFPLINDKETCLGGRKARNTVSSGCRRSIFLTMGDMYGMIFDVRRFSVNDGPGIRTTVFFKGCPLRCVWCHNPEGLESGPELFWDERRCLGSRHRCTVVCPKGALEGKTGSWKLDSGKCDSCGECGRQCPAGAFQIIGSRMTVDELVDRILKDRVFYEHS
jgi:pyruvate formate lyase activating enzyme